MCMAPPKYKMPPVVRLGQRYSPPAYGRIDPHVPHLLGHWVVTYGALGILAGLLLAAVMTL